MRNEKVRILWFAETLNDTLFLSKVWKSAHTERDTPGSLSMKRQVKFLFVPGWDTGPLLYPFRHLAMAERQ